MWIKICGIRDLTTAREVARLQPSAIGLNFYRKTPRSVSLDTAEEVVETLPAALEEVGVFVNAPADEVVATCERCRIATVQLHGDESPPMLAQLASQRPDLKLIRAVRLGPDGLDPLANHLQACSRLGVKIAACLLDARVDGMYGGTGATVPWETVAGGYRRNEWPRLILAGGLTAENVAQAIEIVRPWGVDVSSGVEQSPGVKDLSKVAAFIERARTAFEAIE